RVLEVLARWPIVGRQLLPVAHEDLALLDRDAELRLGADVAAARRQQLGFGRGDLGAPARLRELAPLEVRTTTTAAPPGAVSAAVCADGLAAVGEHVLRAREPAGGLREVAALDVEVHELRIGRIQPAARALAVVDLGALFGVADRVGEVARLTFGGGQ